MYENGKIYMGLAGGKRVELALNMCNRHGLIAGASGTGKTVTMKVMAESFSDAGVPVFLCDVKGDVAGICAPGQSSEGSTLFFAPCMVTSPWRRFPPRISSRLILLVPPDENGITGHSMGREQLRFLPPLYQKG